MKIYNHFFKSLASKRKLSEYIDVLDWLLNDNRLSTLNSKKKGKFTSMLKNYMKNKNIIFMNFDCNDEAEVKNKNEKYFFFYSYSRIGCEKIIEYIRNSIAHGNCYLETIKGETLFVAKDFNNQNKLVAIIRIPLSMIKYLYELYIQLSNEDIYEENGTNDDNSKKVLAKV